MKQILLTCVCIATISHLHAIDFVLDTTQKPDSVTILKSSIDNGKIFILAQLKKDHYTETIHAHSFTCSLGGQAEYSTFVTNSLDAEPRRDKGETAKALMQALRNVVDTQKNEAKN